MIIVARLIVATVSSPMRDDIGSKWLRATAMLRLTVSPLSCCGINALFAHCRNHRDVIFSAHKSRGGFFKDFYRAAR